MSPPVEPTGTEAELVAIAAQAASLVAGQHVVLHGGFDRVAPGVRQRVPQGGVGHVNEARRGGLANSGGQRLQVVAAQRRLDA